MILMMTVGA